MLPPAVLGAILAIATAAIPPSRGPNASAAIRRRPRSGHLFCLIRHPLIIAPIRAQRQALLTERLRCGSCCRHDWLVGAVAKRLREEFGKLQVEINDEKSRIVDLEQGESFGFLGFDFRYLRSRRGAWRPHYTPKLKKRTALMRELKAVFRRYRSQPIERVINLIDPVLRGWVNYFAVGHSSECFSFIKDWVEKKVRRQLAHAQKRKGFGWER